MSETVIYNAFTVREWRLIHNAVAHRIAELSTQKDLAPELRAILSKLTSHGYGKEE